jgi:integrase
MNDSEEPDGINSTALDIIEPVTGLPLLAMIASAGERARLRFIDFFTAHIRNPNTRAADGVAVRAFFDWLAMNGITEVGAIRTHHVSTYIELLTHGYNAPTVKQHLAAIRLAHCRSSGRPELRQRRCADPRISSRKATHRSSSATKRARCLTASTCRRSLACATAPLIALLIYSFARISAALQMNVDHYYPPGKRWWVRLHEKGGKQHEMPAHHLLEQYLDPYVTAAGLTGEKNAPLFPTLGGGRKQLTGKRMSRQDARRMIVRRATKPGLLTQIGCHSFRATGITVYLLNGGLLEYAQQMAAHESARTTKLYDRRNDQITLDQVERLVL